MLSWQRLRERKLFHWAVAYLAAAWLALQVIDVVGDKFGWPGVVFRIATVLLLVGFLVALVIAWYHGEKGEQRVSGVELGMLAALLVVAGVAVAYVNRNAVDARDSVDQPTALAAAHEKSVAVLPFEALSSDKENEYFSDGITDEVLNYLARVPGLRVAARTSSFSFKGKHVPVDEIGQRLGVASVLEGSVRKAGDSLRITAQLVNVRDGYHVWSETYNRKLADVFAVQQDIAQEIVAALKIEFGASQLPATASTSDIEAYSLYLQGKHYRDKFTEADLRRAQDLYRQALGRDPNYAEAQTEIAFTWVVLADDWLPPKEAEPRVRENALKALEMNPRLSLAHSLLAAVYYNYEYDFAAAEKSLRKALELNPNDSDALASLALVIGHDRPVEARAALDRARTLDPVSASSAEWIARMYLNMRDFDRAISEARRGLQLDPSHTTLHARLGDALLAKDSTAEALRVYEQGLAVDPQFVVLRAARARALAQLDRKAEAEQVARELEAESERRYLRAEEIACIYAALGNNERAFAWLERAFKDRSSGLAHSWGRPMYDPLRGDPRFQKLQRQLFGAR